MTKRFISMLLALCMILSVLPVAALAAQAAEGDLPATLSVLPSETNNIPAAINLYQTSSTTGGGGWGGGWGGGNTSTTTNYHLYLPGNVDASKCFFSWDGGLTTVDGNATYASGALPVPAPGETKTYTFTNNGGSKKFAVTTYQGSAAVKPIFIEIDESLGTIDAMNNDRNHETECTGTIFIDGQQYGLPKMKGRGNATWTQARQKRAYNLTLDSKVNILGIDSGKTKKWSILANIADHSLLRCKVGFDMAHEMGIGQDSASADVWMNGKYLGTYLVTPKTDSFVTKDGYALENDNYKEKPIAEGGDPSFDLEGMHGVTGNWIADYEYDRITVKKIGENLLEGGVENVETLTAASAQIQAYMQEAWDAIRSPNGYNSQGKYYTDYVDMPSWAAMYLMHEYIKSFDVNAGSILFHRDGTADSDKLIAGPLWDLDNAMGRTSNNGLLGSGVDQMSGSGWYIRNISDTKTSIFKTLGQHEDFMEEVTRVYNKYKYVFEGAQANLDQLADEMSASAEMNFKKVTSETYNNANVSRQTTKDAGTEYEQVYKVTSTWSDYVDNLRTYVKARSLFFSNNLTKEYPVEEFEATFKVGSGASITTFDTQDITAEGHPNATTAVARNSETGEVDITGDGQVNFKVNTVGDFRVAGVTVTPAENFKNLKDLGDGVYRVTKVTGPITIEVETSEYVCPHELVDGTCKLCGKTAFRADFICDERSSVTVYPTQDLTVGGEENVKFAYAKVSSTGAIDFTGDGQVNFVVNVADGYKVDTITAEGGYKNLKDLGSGAYRLTKVNGAVTVTITTKLDICEHEYAAVVTAPTCTEGGFTTYTCTLCGKTYVADATEALGHDWDEGVITVKPTTKVEGEKTFSCSRCDATYTEVLEKLPQGASVTIDFTDPADAAKFDVVNKKNAAIVSGTGLTLTATRPAFEPCNGQNSGAQATTPEDVIVIPVSGDFTATLRFTFSTGSARNGYYQFFGFYAAEGDDFQNMAGIRGGDGAMQNFLRVKGNITADSSNLNSAPGLATNGATYWYRIEKDGDTYTCYRSNDGEDWAVMFAYADTGIEADCIVIDAYTGMTEGYQFTLKTLDVEAVGVVPPAPCKHEATELKNAKAATCTEAGYTGDLVCTACGETVEQGEVIEAVGHKTELKNVKAATCTEAGYTGDKVCSVCGETVEQGEVIEAMGHKTELKNVKAATCTEAGYTGDQVCSVCGDIIDQGEAIEAMGHDWDNGVVTKPATATEEGVRTFSCSRCDAKREETIEKIVLPALAIVTQPESFVGLVGETAKFAVEVNRPDVTYKWLWSNDGGKIWEVSGQTGCNTAEVSVQLKTFRNGQLYKVVVTDSTGATVESVPVKMSTPTELKVTKNPADVKVAVNEVATFTVTAEGEIVSYQWMYSNNGGAYWSKSTADGATTASMTIAGKAFRNGQMYKCVVTDVHGNVVESASAIMTVG